jgi:hypothetical protein
MTEPSEGSSFLERYGRATGQETGEAGPTAGDEGERTGPSRKVKVVRPSKRRPRFRLGAVIAIAALVGFGAWLLVRHYNSSSPSSTASTHTGAVAVTRSGLSTVADTLGQPIYWAGPIAGTTYELTQTPDGRIYVRYLPRGVAPGSPNPYLTIATYSITNAYADTSTAARGSGTVRVNAGPNAIAFYEASRPTNVYEAFKGSNFQIEVYSPSAQQARRMVTKHQIVPTGNATSATSPTVPQNGAAAATPATLTATAAKVGHPIYWIGPESGVTYELTQTADGRIFLRYLPTGVKVGSPNPYLTVGTYPLTNAYSETKAASKATGAVTIPVKDGIAFYNSSRPTNVYVAFRGSDEQIEVYDPSDSGLEKLIASGHVKPVS